MIKELIISFPHGSFYIILITELDKRIFPILFTYHLNKTLNKEDATAEFGRKKYTEMQEEKNKPQNLQKTAEIIGKFC